MINEFFLKNGLVEVSTFDFYRKIFPVGSFEEKGVFERGKYNGILVEVTKEKRLDGSYKVLRHTLTDDLDKLKLVCGRNYFSLISPISYAGKSRESKNARFLYALAIDLDGIQNLGHLDFFWRQVTQGHKMIGFIWGLPRPTFLVSSGSGIHIYYVFEKPIPLFPNIVKQLEVLKKRLTWQAWTQGASALYENVQYESLFQGFRIPGTITKCGGRAKAYQFEDGKKVTLEYLNQFVPPDHRVKDILYKSELTLEKAKEKYPEWYEKRIVQGKPKGSWRCKPDLYYWWIRKVYEGVYVGHRYWCILVLATYAKKCGIGRKQLEKDAFELLPFLESKTKDENNHFTEEDVIHALEAYNDGYITYPISAIIARTDIHFEKNKRNFRKREAHIKSLNNTRKFRRDELGENEYRNNGRPKGSGTAEQTIRLWRKNNPDGTKKECKEQTGLTYPTIRKWWNDEND